MKLASDQYLVIKHTIKIFVKLLFRRTNTEFVPVKSTWHIFLYYLLNFNAKLLRTYVLLPSTVSVSSLPFGYACFAVPQPKSESFQSRCDKGESEGTPPRSGRLERRCVWWHRLVVDLVTPSMPKILLGCKPGQVSKMLIQHSKL